MLDERKRKILQAIIDDYIQTAEPIGSRTIARKYNLGISSATIRNEMSDLEILGYLEQPHTSAGRVPSVKGYRLYVDSLLSPQPMNEREIHLIQDWYQQKVERIEEVFQETAKLLSKVTRNISLVLAPQYSQSKFKYLQFLPLDAQRVILLVVADTGYVENRIVDLPSGASIEDLQLIAVRITNRLTGLPFHAIKSALLKDIEADLIERTGLLEFVFRALKQALQTKRKEKVYLGGTTQALNQPEFRDVEKIKALLGMLEEESLLCDILHMQEQDGVIVTIGQENKYSGIHDCSVVQATYQIDGEILGTVAVLGPTRMEYGKIMSALEYMHSHLGQLLSRFKP